MRCIKCIKLGFVFLWSLIIGTNLLAQTYTNKKNAPEKLMKTYKEGLIASGQEDFEKALKIFTACLKTDPNFIDAHIQMAVNHNRLGQTPEAETAFEKALAIDPNYEPALLFSVALAEVKQDKYSEAAVHYDAYAQNAKADAESVKKAIKSAKDCRFIEKSMKNPVPFTPKSLGEKVNTSQFSEYLPIVTADGETLIYTALINGQEDFFIAKRLDSVWQNPQPLTDLNTPSNEGAQCISADGRTLFFTACNRPSGFGSCDILFSKYKDGKWSASRPFASVCTEFWESQPSVSADGRTLFFASDRPGGLGKRDIWFIKFENGKWSEAKNIGAPINTASDDQTPFFHPDGETLYFASDGHESMGGIDLYAARLQADGTWAAPQNLGYPINSRDNEATLSVAIDGKTAYYARNIAPKGSTSNYDLFSFELPLAARAQPLTYVRARVTDAQTRKPILAARLEFIDLETQKPSLVSATDENGSFLVCLPLGKNIALNVGKEKYIFHSENFNLSEVGNILKPFLLDIALQPIKIEGANPTSSTAVAKEEPKPIVLKNIFFETNKATLKPASVAELTKLKWLLSENPNMKIEIRGHTDNVGVAADNQILSQKRAEAVRTWLAQNGVDAGRLTARGLGMNEPIETNDNEIGRAKNRRTDFILRDN
jgi:outer membrane protein OmpA-like peptidoglycan-associated protein/tetratricopeptide (TPR) repeat protein